jgi:hypothetical protein
MGEERWNMYPLTFIQKTATNKQNPIGVTIFTSNFFGDGKVSLRSHMEIELITHPDESICKMGS